MSYPQDFFGSSPKTVLNKPFFHAQDQKAYNVDGGSSIADAWTTRTLNTVITNDIQGASLSSNQVSLPAGTYYVEVETTFRREGANAQYISGIFAGGVRKLQGIGVSSGGVGGNFCSTVKGVVILSGPDTIDIRYIKGESTTTYGLGNSNSSGAIPDITLNSIYADLKIWQLDRSLEIAPKSINSGLQTIAGMNTEGGIMGGNVTVSGNTLTITKCSCMSSDLTIAMAMTADHTVVLPATANQDFYVFMVRLVADGTFDYKAYTTYVGPSSDALVDRWRFVSYAKNNASGVTMPYSQVGNHIDFISKILLTASVTGTIVQYSISNIIPTTLFNSLCLHGGATNYETYISLDGSNEHCKTLYGGTWVSSRATIGAATYNNTAAIYIISATLRR